MTTLNINGWILTQHHPVYRGETYEARKTMRTVQQEIAKQLKLFKFHSAKSEHYRYLAERRMAQGRFSTAVFYQELSAAQWHAADQHRRNWQHAATPPLYVQQYGRGRRLLPYYDPEITKRITDDARKLLSGFKDGEYKIGDVITLPSGDK